MRRFLVIFISAAALLASQMLGEGFYDIDEHCTQSEEITAEFDYDHASAPISIHSGSQIRVPSASRRALSSNSKIYTAHSANGIIYDNNISFFSSANAVLSVVKLSTIFRWHRIRI